MYRASRLPYEQYPIVRQISFMYAREELAADHARVRLVAFDDPRPLADIDTPEDYERLREGG